MKVNLTQSILSTAAQMFGGDERIRVRPGSPMTDGTNVYLPGFKENMEPEEAMLVRGYFAHECAHILYKSFSPAAQRIIRNAPLAEYLGKTQLRDLFNVTEDVRIEQLVCQDNIGAGQTIDATRTACVEKNNAMNPFGGDKPTSKQDVWGQITHALIWRMHGTGWRSRVTYCPVGFEIIDSVTFPSEAKFMKKVRSGKAKATTAARLACEMFEILDKFFADKADGEGELEGPQAETETQNDASTSIAIPATDGADSEDNESSESKEGGQGETAEEAEQVDPDNGPPTEGVTGEPEQQDPSGDWSEAVGWSSNEGDNDLWAAPPVKDMGHELIEELSRDSLTGTPYEERVNLGEIVQYYREIKKSHRFTTSVLASIYNYPQLHAEAMRLGRTLRPLLSSVDKVGWSQPRETGNRLDLRTMPRFAAGMTNRVFNVRRIDHAEKTLVTILVDYSSSMRFLNNDRMAPAPIIMQTAHRTSLMIADACESIGVPTAIIGFEDQTWVEKQPGIRVNPAMRVRAWAQGNTNLTSALLLSEMVSNRYPTHRHVQFVLTDGATQGEEAALSVLRGSHESGTDQYGISLQGGMEDSLSRYFRDDANGHWEIHMDTDSSSLAAAIESGLRQSSTTQEATR